MWRKGSRVSKNQNFHRGRKLQSGGEEAGDQDFVPTSSFIYVYSFEICPPMQCGHTWGVKIANKTTLSAMINHLRSKVYGILSFPEV